MVPFYLSSEKDKRKEEAFNTCIKSLQNMLDYHQFKESKQDYTQITYNGPFTNISSAKITYPRQLSKQVPLIGTVGGYLMILGYTDGISISTTSIEPPNRKLKVESETERVEVESMGSNSTKVEKTENKASGVKIVTTTTTTISYEETKEEEQDEEGDIVEVSHYWKVTKVVVDTEIDRSGGDVNICMRF